RRGDRNEHHPQPGLGDVVPNVCPQDRSPRKSPSDREPSLFQSKPARPPHPWSEGAGCGNQQKDRNCYRGFGQLLQLAPSSEHEKPTEDGQSEDKRRKEQKGLPKWSDSEFSHRGGLPRSGNC